MNAMRKSQLLYLNDPDISWFEDQSFKHHYFDSLSTFSSFIIFLYIYLLNSEMLKNIVLLFKTNILKYKMIILSDGLC